MAPTWSQDGAKSPQVGAKMVILRPFGELFGAFLVVLGAIFRKWPKCKNEQRSSVLATFWSRGGSGWRLLGSILGDLGHKLGLGTSWALLGDLGHKLGTSWQHAVRKLAEGGLR